MSPELTLRPSLSGVLPGAVPEAHTRVAGANAPAFVERPIKAMNSRSETPCVAGANAPAFVERSPSSKRESTTPGHRGSDGASA